MKKIQIAAFLAIAGAGISAQAQTYSSGDLLIGFRSTSGGISTDYLIDVGQNLFARAALGGGSVTIGNFGTDLSAFDANWFTDGTTKWGVIGGSLATDSSSGGTGGASEVYYAGIAETAAQHPWLATSVGTTYHGRTVGQQTTTISFVDTVGNNFQSGTVNTGTTPSGDTGGFNYPGLQEQFQTAGAANTPSNVSWLGQVAAVSGSGFRLFSGFEGTATTGSAGNKLDLFQVTPGVTNPVYEGTFTVASNGLVTFNSPVPEPSTVTALLGGISLLGLLRRRRAVTA